MNNNYVKVEYEKTDKPFSSYPLELAQYFVNRFHLAKGMKLLDNGCGRGEFLHAFSKCGLITTGTDMSDYCPNVQIVDLEVERLPFDDESFDVVFSKSVLEHISNMEHYMAEMKRVLKQGGVIIIMVPDWNTQHKIFFNDPTHIHPFNKESIEKLLLIQKYISVNSEEFIQLPCVWDNKVMKIISGFFRLFGPAKKIYKNKFIRFSRELMILGSGIKAKSIQ